MFFACYIKWYESLDKAFEEAALLRNPSFRIRTEFFGDEDNIVYSELEQTLIKEYFTLYPAGIGGCIAEIIVPVTTEINSKYWVQDKEWDKLRSEKTDYDKTFKFLFPTEREEEQQLKELEKEFLEEQSYDIYVEHEHKWQ